MGRVFVVVPATKWLTEVLWRSYIIMHNEANIRKSSWINSLNNVMWWEHTNILFAKMPFQLQIKICTCRKLVHGKSERPYLIGQEVTRWNSIETDGKGTNACYFSHNIWRCCDVSHYGVTLGFNNPSRVVEVFVPLNCNHFKAIRTIPLLMSKLC